LAPQGLIFEGISQVSPKRHSLYGSVAVHCLFLAWLLHSPAATFVSPLSIQHGENGQALTEIYWTGEKTLTDQRTLEKGHLTWSAPPKDKRHHRPAEPEPDKGPEDTAISASRVDSAVPAAGSPYGSLTYGSVSGLEVRPAIRISGSEPRLDSEDLANITEGNEIIELTIDDQGNIIDRKVIQSLGPIVDARVMAALNDWHFRPATRDGAAIPSKQDVYYHFPVRR